MIKMSNEVEEIKMTIEQIGKDIQLLELRDFITKQTFEMKRLKNENEALKENIHFTYTRLMNHINGVDC
jgi:hypothetical protein